MSTDRPFLHDQWCVTSGCSRVGAELQIGQRGCTSPRPHPSEAQLRSRTVWWLSSRLLPNSSSYPRAYGACFAGCFGLAEQGDHVGHAAFFLPGLTLRSCRDQTPQVSPRSSAAAPQNCRTSHPSHQAAAMSRLGLSADLQMSRVGDQTGSAHLGRSPLAARVMSARLNRSVASVMGG
jgi:hypothetical protein